MNSFTSSSTEIFYHLYPLAAMVLYGSSANLLYLLEWGEAVTSTVLTHQVEMLETGGSLRVLSLLHPAVQI